MEDDLNNMEDNLTFFQNGRRPQIFHALGQDIIKSKCSHLHFCLSTLYAVRMDTSKARIEKNDSINYVCVNTNVHT